METGYRGTNASLYEDIALWERTEGAELMRAMPMDEKASPRILDFGFGFGEYLFAAAYAYPGGTVYGIDGGAVCVKEVSAKIGQRGLGNIRLIGEEVADLRRFEDGFMDMVLLYDVLHASFSRKDMLLRESRRVLKAGGCLSVLPFHPGNWADAAGNKRRVSPARIRAKIEGYGFEYAGTCPVPGVHWEKCHTQYYIRKGTIAITDLERMDIANFRAR